MKDKLLIIDKLKRTIIYIDKTLDNFPHRNIELKQNINRALYEMLECTYLANNGFEKERNKNQAIIKLQMIDFYLMLSFKKNIISKKKYESIAKHLLEIRKMLFGWLETSEESR